MADERIAVLRAVQEHDAGTRSLIFDVPGGLAFRPGQFISCLLPIGGERLIRPYSIASDPGDGTRIELLLNLVEGGPGSRHLFGLRPGATLSFTGPWGTFVLDRAPNAEAVFVAIETGIAPIRPMLHRASRTTAHPLALLHATGLPLYRTELAALPHLTTAIVPPEEIETTVEARYLAADADRSRHFFICGAGDVVRRLRDRLRASGYGRRAVQYERW